MHVLYNVTAAASFALTQPFHCPHIHHQGHSHSPKTAFCSLLERHAMDGRC